MITKYSLLSRFQGCLEGMAIADCMTLPGDPVWSSAQWDIPPSPWVETAFHLTEALIQTSGWSFEPPTLEIPASIVADHSGTLAIATLPLALFFHDDLVLQGQQLRQTVQTWGGTTAMADWVVVFGYAIAQALKQQLIPAQFSAQLIAYLNRRERDLAERSAEIMPALKLLESLMDQGTASGTALLQIEQLVPQAARSVVRALYYFLSTPDHWHLAVTHAIHLNRSQAVVAVLTGSLSGAYNSHSSLPLAWKVACLPTRSSGQLSSLSLTSCKELAVRLLAAWSGIVNPSCPLIMNTLPVAFPRR